MATDPEPRLLTADEFLEIDFGPNLRAELDNGVIRMMTGGTGRHARLQRNLIRFLGAKLRGSGCSPFGPDIGVRTHSGSIRYPDVAIYCGRDGPDSDEVRAFDDPIVAIEVLSPSTSHTDTSVKIWEYCALPSVQTIVFIDPSSERSRVVQRTGPVSWTDSNFLQETDIELPSLNLTVPHAEIFARD